MGRSPDKWFAMRTDFFSADAYHLGFFKLSPVAAGMYVASIAYVSRWGNDECYGRQVGAYLGVKRPKQYVDELVREGFWLPTKAPGAYCVMHEGTLWRRGDGVRRRAIPAATRAAVMKRDDFACVECGSHLFLTLDHIWPYSQGGTDDHDNLRVLCRSCNSKKGARTDGA